MFHPDVVSGDTNLPFDDQEVQQCETPPHHHQNRMAKYHQRKIFDINSMLKAVEEKEKEKILSQTIGDQQDFFTKATLNYFQKLIKDARHGFHSKVEGAQLMHSIFGDKLDEVDFNMWLVNALKLKDRNELIMFLSYSGEESSAIILRGCKLLSINECEPVYNFWKINSEISSIRSNGQHFIKISKENILTQVSDI